VIVCKSPEEIARMRVAAELVADILDALRPMVQPGVSTLDLDLAAERMARAAGAEPAFKGYQGFPGSLCTSVNDEVVHGIPSATRVLREGDIVSIDMGVRVGGFYGDAAVTLPVGQVSGGASALLRVTEESLWKGIAEARPGNRVSDIGHAVQAHVESAGFSVVRQFVGHGIGRALHEEPQVPNYGTRGRGPRLAPGMVLAIEPMVNAGRAAVRELRDNWTQVTADGSLSAHFEHTVAVTADGPLVLTRSRRARQAAEVMAAGEAGRRD
jgi:methionyl aminopeptidase